MKNITFPLLLLISSCALGQDSLSWYYGAGLSMTNGSNIRAIVYPSLEVGATIGQKSIALNLGRRDLMSEDKEMAEFYYWEIKGAYSVPFDRIQLYGLLGAGGFFETDDFLIEYGAGVSMPVGSTSIWTQVSHWYGAPYVSIGFQRPF
jgi:hypothetical protein